MKTNELANYEFEIPDLLMTNICYCVRTFCLALQVAVCLPCSGMWVPPPAALGPAHTGQ